MQEHENNNLKKTLLKMYCLTGLGRSSYNCQKHFANNINSAKNIKEMLYLFQQNKPTIVEMDENKCIVSCKKALSYGENYTKSARMKTSSVFFGQINNIVRIFIHNHANKIIESGINLIRIDTDCLTVHVNPISPGLLAFGISPGGGLIQPPYLDSSV